MTALPSRRARRAARAAAPASALVLVLAALGALAPACDRGGPPPPEREPSRSAPERPPAEAPTATDAGAAAPSPPVDLGALVDAAAPAAPSGASALAGAWEGTYDAKKGAVGLPPKVKDKTWTADDGKTAIGAGTIALTVAPSGEVSGSAKGALGNQTITGQIDEGSLRARVMPDDPGGPNAMTGVLIGLVKGDTIQAEIRVAGPDAVTVRESTVVLQRKP